MAFDSGTIVEQAIGNLDAPLGPGDPKEIAWVNAQQTAFAKWLRKEWAKGPDLEHLYVVAFYDANRQSREAASRRGKAKSNPAG